ncbi:hypothetical protein [Streptomyces sp. NPDC059452]|uniref:hypothetical protein n=1 Tax=Streptomyces sp. NPDC059452 TaxID=3346835 RepID=UPI0036C040D6
MTQTPNGAENTGRTPDRATPSTGAERVPPMTPPGTAPVPQTAVKPAESSPKTTGTLGSSVEPTGTPTDPGHTDPARTDGTRDTGRPATSPASTDTGRAAGSPSGTDTGRPLFAPEEREKFDARIHQAVAGFVENPRRAVQEADATFDEVVAGLTDALATRSRLLRADRDGEQSEAGTEDLRIALQHYRDLTRRLVRL